MAGRWALLCTGILGLLGCGVRNAAALALTVKELGEVSGEWVVCARGDCPLFVGRYPGASLCTVDRLLKDGLGAHWWNPREETVPRSSSLVIGTLCLRAQPGLRCRDIDTRYGNDQVRSAAHNRFRACTS